MTTADRLAQLVDKSLVQSASSRAGRRFRLLETVRASRSTRIERRGRRGGARPALRVLRARGRDRSARSCPGPTRTPPSARLAVDFDDVGDAFDVRRGARDDVETAARLARGPAPVGLDRGRAVGAARAARGRACPASRSCPRTSRCSRARRGARSSSATCPRARALAAGRRSRSSATPRSTHACAGSGPRRPADRSPKAPTAASRARPRRPSTATRQPSRSCSARRRSTGLAAGDERAAVEHAERALDLARQIGSRTLRTRAAGALSYALQDIDAAGRAARGRGSARDRGARRLPPEHAAPGARHPRVARRRPRRSRPSTRRRRPTSSATRATGTCRPRRCASSR